MDKKSNILIVDDMVDARDTVKNVLYDMEVSFLEAENGEKALELIKNNKLDLIILDIKLPGIDGIETFKRAKDLDPTLPPVIVLTAHTDIPPAVDAGKLGVFDYLIKDPLPFEPLRDSVRKALLWKNKANNTIVKRCFKFGFTGCKYEIPIQKDLVFIGIPFSLPDVYKFGIRAAVESFGLNCWHAYEDKRLVDITCKICGSLQASRFAIMDISGLNPNVLFEIGLAYGYGKCVIILKDMKTDIPTDLKGFEYVEYSTINSLREKLKEHLRAILS